MHMHVHDVRGDEESIAVWSQQVADGVKARVRLRRIDVRVAQCERCVEVRERRSKKGGRDALACAAEATFPAAAETPALRSDRVERQHAGSKGEHWHWRACVEQHGRHARWWAHGSWPAAVRTALGAPPSRPDARAHFGVRTVALRRARRARTPTRLRCDGRAGMTQAAEARCHGSVIPPLFPVNE